MGFYKKYQTYQKYYLNNPVEPSIYKKGDVLNEQVYNDIFLCRYPEGCGEYWVYRTQSTAVSEKYQSIQGYKLEFSHSDGNYAFYNILSVDAQYPKILVGDADLVYGGYLPKEPNTTSEMFKDCTDLIIVNINQPLTESITDMFNGCKNLSLIKNIEEWDTSNVWFIKGLFNGCESLTSLDLSGWNTSNFNTTFYSNNPSSNDVSMFNGCSSLTSLNLSGWDTGGFATLRNMFSGCSSLTSLDVSGWNTSQVKDMYGLFYGCTLLETIDLSDWDISNVGYFSLMFTGCNSLTEITGIENWGAVRPENNTHIWYTTSMFEGCTSLTSLDLSGWDFTYARDVGYMFRNCKSLTSLNLSGWTKNRYYDYSLTGLFDNCISLETLYLDGWDTSNIEFNATNYMFRDCTALRTIYMRGCSSDTIADIESVLTDAGIRNNVTIVTA